MAGLARWLGLGRSGQERQTALPVAYEYDPREAEREAEAQSALPEPLAGMLAEIEASARGLYEQHGLPTRPGHYRREPGGVTWTFLASDLPVEERWRMVLEQPPEHGWRYARLEDIGLIENRNPETVQASRLLSSCGRLRRRVEGLDAGSPAEDIAEALRLGAEWARTKQTMPWRDGSRLRLTGVALPGRE